MIILIMEYEKIREKIYINQKYKLTIELFIALNNNNGICRANKFDSNFQLYIKGCTITSPTSESGIVVDRSFVAHLETHFSA